MNRGATKFRRDIMAPGLTLLLFVTGRGFADCILDVTPSPVPPFSTQRALFPNWQTAPAAAFTIVECDDLLCAGCPNSPITGLTIVNYGSATGGPGNDLTGMTYRITCPGKTDSGMVAMTFAGDWIVGGSSRPVWTWAGSLAWGGDPCDLTANCGCAVNLYLYASVGPCPTDGATVELGPGGRQVTATVYQGGVSDACGCLAPGQPVADPDVKTLRYVMKTADRAVAAPGDTVNYTIYYGLPGSAPLTSITITDTIPSSMHVLPGVAPPADPGWDPDPGPPTRLRWTILPPFPASGGPTAALTYAATVDWGNGESFEPGSGDVAAAEGSFLFNSAQMVWAPPGAGECAVGHLSNTTSTVVRRYLFWMIGDNDVLFSPRLGMPDDEIVYEITLRNASATKTWWNVLIQDSVPALIDPFAANQGFDDPCLGWTMTPSGCAAASPGWSASGGVTLLTWVLDLPPSATLTLRWRGKLAGSAMAGDIATNRTSVLAQGSPGRIGGTGTASAPRNFTHEATVILRTTYVSYVGWAGDDSAFFSCTGFTYWISFYPLNKAADFALYKKWCCSAAPCDTSCNAFALNGGVSPKIDVFAGTCTGGPAVDWEMGCKAERAPARYVPVAMAAAFVPSQPHQFLHKMVSNSPLLWELSTCGPKNSADADTYVGTSNLSFAGLITYTYLRVNKLNYNFYDSLHVVNTDDAKDTTLVSFLWDAATRTWGFYDIQDLYRGSHWGLAPPPTDATLDQHYRVISSDSRIIAHKAFVGIGAGGAYNDLGTLAPNRENGNLVNSTLPATFYLFAGHLPGAADVAMVGNLGAAATYEVWRYTPLDTTAPLPNTLNLTLDLAGNAGRWSKLVTHTVPAAGPMPGPTGANPHVYGDNYDASTFSSMYRLYKVVLLSGGPVQTYCGRSIVDRYSGGCMLHPSIPAGNQTGTEYWLHTNLSDHTVAGCGQIMCFDSFSPKTGVRVNLTSNESVLGTFTTTDVDQCVAFRAITEPANGGRRNWKVSVAAGGVIGDIITQYICCNLAEKFYTAPFLQKGQYYDIIVPPVVYAGQSFWMTVVVKQSAATLTTYCGTSSFTSTDATAKLEGVPMDSYNYTWTNDITPCNGGSDDGVRLFFNVTLDQLGLQSLIVSDTLDGSITGLATLQVVGADVKLTKQPPLQVAASGDVVQFKICWSNYSSATASTFTIADAVPNGTVYFPDAPSTHWCGATKGFGAATVAYSSTTDTPGAYATMTGPATTAVQYLKWTIPAVGVATTGCVCFRVTVR